MLKVIGIDPGHGGLDRTNRGPTGYIEADGVLNISIACKRALEAAGYKVVMTRETDKTLSLTDRCKILNNAGVELAVSIHTNAASPKVRGIETIHALRGEKGKRLAEIIAQGLKRDLALPLRRVFSRESEAFPGQNYYTMIQKTKMPLVIVEVEFHSNPEAEALLKSLDFRERAGVSIAKSIIEYCKGA